MVERLEVHAPERAGWIQKTTKLRDIHWNRLFLTSLVASAASTALKLRTLVDSWAEDVGDRWRVDLLGPCARRRGRAADAEASALRGAAAAVELAGALST